MTPTYPKKIADFKTIDELRFGEFVWVSSDRVNPGGFYRVVGLHTDDGMRVVQYYQHITGEVRTFSAKAQSGYPVLVEAPKA